MLINWSKSSPNNDTNCVFRILKSPFWLELKLLSLCQFHCYILDTLYYRNECILKKWFLIYLIVKLYFFLNCLLELFNNLFGCGGILDIGDMKQGISLIDDR